MPWCKLMKGGAYSFPDEGLTFQRDLPAEVSDDLWRRLSHLSKFVLCNPDGSRLAFVNNPNHVYKPTVYKNALEDDGVVTTQDLTSSVDLGFIERAPLPPQKNIITPADDLNEKKILLKRMGGIGDVVFVIHVAEEIKRRWPKCEITIAVRPNLMNFAGSFDAIDLVVSLDDACRYDVVQRHQYILNYNRVIEGKGSYTEDFFDAHWQRTGFEKAPEKLTPLRVSRLSSNPQIANAAQGVLNANGVGALPYVALILGTSNALKRIHIDRLKTIAETIAASNTHVVCIGHDGSQLDRVFETQDQRISFIMNQPLEVNAELVRRSACAVGGDTGLIQFAASVGAPTVSVWGATNPDLTIPHYTGDHEVVRGKIACQPCGMLKLNVCPYYNGGYPDCMRNIDPQEIAGTALRLVKTGVNLALKNNNGVSSPAGILTSNTQTPRTGLRVALLLDNADTFTGGGMYAYAITKNVARMPGTIVSVLTDTEKACVYKRDMDGITEIRGALKQNGTTFDCDLLDNFDLLITTPPVTGGTANRHKEKAGTPYIALVYETPSLIAQYRGTKPMDAQENYWADYKNALLNADSIIVISKPVKQSLREWHPQFEEKHKRIRIVSPPVDSAVADQVIGDSDLVNASERDNSIVIISRNMPYKRVRAACEAIINDFMPSHDCDVHVIGQNVSALRKKLPNHVFEKSAKSRVHLYEDVDELQKWNLIRRAKCVVHPSTFEGFGIVLAEAMYAGTPVLARELPIYKDIFTDTPFYYKEENQLGDALTQMFAAWDAIEISPLKQMIQEARTYAARRYSANASQARVEEVFRRSGPLKKAMYDATQRDYEASAHASANLRVAIISPWGTQCGIAETTRRVVEKYKCAFKIFAANEHERKIAYDDDSRAVRCWDRSFAGYDRLKYELLQFAPTVIHIHHEFSFFADVNKFFAFIKEMKSLGIAVVVTMHTYMPTQYVDDLSRIVDRIVLTKDQPDCDPNHYAFIHLPIEEIPAMSKQQARLALNLPREDFYVGAFGMWQQHKGYKEFLATYNDVAARVGGNTRYVLTGYADPKSRYPTTVMEEFKHLFESGMAFRQNDFMPMDRVALWLHACDALVFNYNIAGHFSASASIRTGMAMERPCICTVSSMFSEFENERDVLKVKFDDKAELVNAITRLKTDKTLVETLVRNASKYVSDCRAENIARQYQSLYQTVASRSQATVGHR